MRVLVVYYSLDGNTRFIAQKIAQNGGGDILELECQKDETRGDFMKFFWGGRQILMKEEPKLKPLHKSPEEYDIIIIGTQVWAWSYTPPLATFFSSIAIKGKKVAVFCCHSGEKGGTLEKMKKKLEGNEILGQIDFRDPLMQDKSEVEEEVRIWTEAVMEKAKVL